MATHRPKVFIVEDHHDSRETISYALTAMGFEVISAGSCADALSLARTTSFDVLVSDIFLPDGDGTELLKELRKLKDFPAIAVSGWCTESDFIRYYEAGFQKCLSKPYSTRVLAEAVMTLRQNT